MTKVKLASFDIIGIAIKTTNENQQSSKDIPQLWETFMKENIIDKIPHKVDTTLYSVYTDYESDHFHPYTTIIGCRVEHLNDIPDGMVGKHIVVGDYQKFSAKGNLTAGVVYDAWMHIWNQDIDRKYTVDFEVYDQRVTDPTDAEVDIFVAV